MIEIHQTEQIQWNNHDAIPWVQLRTIIELAMCTRFSSFKHTDLSQNVVPVEPLFNKHLVENFGNDAKDLKVSLILA